MQGTRVRCLGRELGSDMPRDWRSPRAAVKAQRSQRPWSLMFSFKLKIPTYRCFFGITSQLFYLWKLLLYSSPSAPENRAKGKGFCGGCRCENRREEEGSVMKAKVSSGGRVTKLDTAWYQAQLRSGPRAAIQGHEAPSRLPLPLLIKGWGHPTSAPTLPCISGQCPRELQARSAPVPTSAVAGKPQADRWEAPSPAQGEALSASYSSWQQELPQAQETASQKEKLESKMQPRILTRPRGLW